MQPRLLVSICLLSGVMHCFSTMRTHSRINSRRATPRHTVPCLHRLRIRRCTRRIHTLHTSTRSVRVSTREYGPAIEACSSSRRLFVDGSRTTGANERGRFILEICVSDSSVFTCSAYTADLQFTRI